MTLVGHLVLLAVYATFVWGVFTPAPEAPADEYESSAWP
jgi:hypothetical protein